MPYASPPRGVLPREHGRLLGAHAGGRGQGAKAPWPALRAAPSVGGRTACAAAWIFKPGGIANDHAR